MSYPNKYPNNYPTDLLRLFRATVADLYGTEMEATNLVSDLGLDVTKFDASGTPKDRAYRIVEMARERNKLYFLLGRLVDEYPENDNVRSLRLGFNDWFDQKKVTSQTT